MSPLIERKRLGAFYTPHNAAHALAHWALRHDGDRILEPSFGDGVFLSALRDVVRERRLKDVSISGVELDQVAYSTAVARDLLPMESAFRSDFLAVKPFPVDGVVGNPPYVRLRALPKTQAKRALKSTEALLGTQMDPSGSTWMPFVLHSLAFLRKGGRLAFVLPYDFTYVRYARVLWDVLSQSFGNLRIARVHERVFPEILQEVVLLFADDYGSSTTTVDFQAYERVADFLHERPTIRCELSISDLVEGRKVFVEALLPQTVRDLVAERDKAEFSLQLSRRSTVRIGYVSGDKSFFHPVPETVDRYSLQRTHLLPALTSTRTLRGLGIHTSAIDESDCDLLFLPSCADEMTDGERRYIESGKSSGVADGFKCRTRDPWFIVPDVKKPDLVLSVFSERPILIDNDQGLVASNSLLCLYLSDPTTRLEMASAWYTPWTLLSCELEVHSLGGGVMVLVPREAGNIKLPSKMRFDGEHIAAIDSALRGGSVESAYHVGDQALSTAWGLTKAEVDSLWDGIAQLTHWRTSARSGAQSKDSTKDI